MVFVLYIHTYFLCVLFSFQLNRIYLNKRNFVTIWHVHKESGRKANKKQNIIATTTTYITNAVAHATSKQNIHCHTFYLSHMVYHTAILVIRNCKLHKLCLCFLLRYIIGISSKRYLCVFSLFLCMPPPNFRFGIFYLTHLTSKGLTDFLSPTRSLSPSMCENLFQMGITQTNKASKQNS